MTNSLSRIAAPIIAVTLLLTSLLGYGTTPALAAVGLTSFEVAPGNSNSELVATWETETEVDTIAFQLKRATTEDPAAATLAATLPARGSGVGGASYEHTDGSLTTGTRYYYWLYEVTSGGALVLLHAPVSGTPGQPAEATAAPTDTRPATATATATTRPATATSTATSLPTQQNNPSASNTPTFTPVPSNTPLPATNTPIPTSPPAAAAATNPPVVTNTPPPASTPVTPEAVAATATSTDAAVPETQPAPATDSQPAPATDGQPEPATDGERAESPDQVIPSSPTVEGDAVAPTGLTSVETPTAQAVAEVEANAAEAQETQPTVVRPTATPRPSRADEGGSTTGLLAVVGGGSLCAAALLALVAIFIWRRR